MTFSLCRADVPDGEPVSADNQRVALNQSVSIDGTTSAAARAASTGPGEAAVETAPESTDPAVVARRGKQLSRAAGTGRNLKPARRQISATAVSVDRPVPWYRTGFGALAIVLVLIGGLVWVVRRWVPAARGGDSHLLRVVGRASLSPKHSVALVQLGRRFVMVGVSGERVNTLCEVNDPDEVAELCIRAGASGVQGADGFDRLLLEEATDYREVSRQEANEARSVPVTTVRTRQSLFDLLRRLRTLQSK
ncbi:MAG: flagellar biosynthetic protein FliO [Phycisphaerae bacterium]